jgi:hypothetical protein
MNIGLAAGASVLEPFLKRTVLDPLAIQDPETSDRGVLDLTESEEVQLCSHP